MSEPPRRQNASPTPNDMPSPIRVLIADDHPLWRRGVRDFLGLHPEIEVVAEAGDGAEALRLMRALALDVAVVDMEMPGLSGVEVARVAAAEGLGVRVLGLSSFDDEPYVDGLMDGGAAGYITKGKPPEMIAEAVVAVARGEGRWFVNPQRSPLPSAGLTEREREVLVLMARGRSNAEIAEQLYISPHTVRNHVGRCFGKLGVTSSREAVAWAWKNGLVAGDE